MKSVEAGGMRVPRTSDPLADPLSQGSAISRRLNARAFSISALPYV